MKDTLAIKLPVGDVPAKACMAIKQRTGAFACRDKAQDVYLFVCDYVDDEGLKLINGMRREMKKYGIAVRQFEDGVERPPELFDNIESMHDEINRGYR